MRSQIIPLGSGGWIPTTSCETASYAFRHGDSLYILDAGSGMARLLNPYDESLAALKDGVARVYILLTHYHLDHVLGLFYLKAIFPNIPTYIYAPGRGIYDSDATGMIERIFDNPLSPRSIMELHGMMEINDLAMGNHRIGKLKFDCRLQKNHSDPSVGIRVANSFAYITDTTPEDETIDFIKGCDLLLHEVWYSSRGNYRGMDDDLTYHSADGHCGSVGAAIIAQKAGIDELRFVHHNPMLPAEKRQKLAAEVSDIIPNTMLARDLLPIDIVL